MKDNEKDLEIKEVIPYDRLIDQEKKEQVLRWFVTSVTLIGTIVTGTIFANTEELLPKVLWGTTFGLDAGAYVYSQAGLIQSLLRKAGLEQEAKAFKEKSVKEDSLDEEQKGLGR